METQPADDAQMPAGYRVVAVASDTWILIAPGGARIARYFGDLERWRAARDATDHLESRVGRSGAAPGSAPGQGDAGADPRK